MAPQLHLAALGEHKVQRLAERIHVLHVVPQAPLTALVKCRKISVAGTLWIVRVVDAVARLELQAVPALQDSVREVDVAHDGHHLVRLGVAELGPLPKLQVVCANKSQQVVRHDLLALVRLEQRHIARHRHARKVVAAIRRVSSASSTTSPSAARTASSPSSSSSSRP